MEKSRRDGITRILTVIFLLIFAISLNIASDFAAGCRELREDLFRLHILAASDAPEDQALKLLVRDRILEESRAWTEFSGDKNALMAKVQAELPKIEAAAEETLAENGCDLPVTAEISRVFFDTRVYGERTVPAGWYDALRLTIGSGEGQNWWCVLYPPLCLPAVEGEAILSTALSDGERAVLSSGKYRVRFLTVELAERLLNWLKQTK